MGKILQQDVLSQVYNAFFGFRKAPFASTPDPEFFFRSDQHDSALKGLLLSVEARMGLVTLLGSEGTGKTVVLECLRNSLGPDIPCAFIRNSRISLSRYFETLTSDLNLDLRFVIKSDAQIFLALTRFAAQQARSGRTVVLIVDEAHDLPADVFTEILHFASLLHDKVKAIQTVFAGRPELQPRLAELNPKRIGQRAILSRSLHAFTARETQEYIEFRLTCAGMATQTVFPRKALDDIYERSQGFAPAIHALCHQLLLTAFSSTSKVCTREICDQVLKKPHTKLTQILADARTVVAVRIDRLRLAAPPPPEPPPMQTVLLRVPVDARPGSLAPTRAGTDERPVQLPVITSKIVLPLGRLTLAGADLPVGSTRPMRIRTCTKASEFRPSLQRGWAIASIPVAGLSPRLPRTAMAEACTPSSLQLPVTKLIALGHNVRLRPPHTPVLAGQLQEFFSPVLQPTCPRASLEPASVIPWSRVALAPLHATKPATLLPAASRFVEMEPGNLIPVGCPSATALSASPHPSVGRSNAMLPLALRAHPISLPAETPIGLFLSAEPALPARLPILRLKPADPSRSPAWIPRIANFKIPWSSPSDTLAATRTRLASHRKPLLAFVISILAALALYNAPLTMRAAADTSRQGWQRARQAVLNRAAIALDEDFRAGLSDWTNRGGSAPSWRSDPSGFVHPGALALYRPSLGMVDYRMQFLGTIDKKALSWAVRAADFNNYYAIRLTVLKPGPLPLIGVTRYAVIHGIPQKHVTTPLLMRAQADTVYHVSLDIQGDRFALSVQDQPVETWSEPRLGHGSIGFFSENDARSRIASLHVRGHYDMLGRLCALLIPSSISSSR